MKSIFDPKTRAEVISRVEKLTADSQPQWGEMTVDQMVRHCAKWEKMILGKEVYKQSFMGKLFGKFALKDMMKDEPAKHNLPTVPCFKMTDDGDFSTDRLQWISLLKEHDIIEPSGFMHPFFGMLTIEQAGQMDYKHIDHHLKQFGV